MILLFVVFFSCNSSNDVGFSIEETTDSLVYHSSDTVSKLLNYSVVSEDYVGDWLQRVFIEVDLKLINDSVSLKNIINNLSNKYKFSSNSSISFFKEANYAMYLDALLRENEDVSNVDSLVFLWKNEQYLGEYSFEDSSIVLYPAR